MCGHTTSDIKQLQLNIIAVRHDYPDEEYQLCQQLKELALQANDSYALCFADLYTCDSLYDRGCIEKALKVGKQALEEQNKHNFYDLMLIQNNLLAIIYKHYDDEQSAMEHYFRALKLAKMNQDHIMLCAIYTNLANLYLNQGAYQQADATFHSAEEAYYHVLHNQHNINFYPESLRFNQAFSSFENKRYQEALTTVSELLSQLTFETQASLYMKGFLLKCKILSSLEEFTTLNSCLDQCLSLSFSKFNLLMRFDFYQELIELCFVTKRTDDLIRLLSKCYGVASRIKLPNKWVTYYDLLIRFCDYIESRELLDEALEQYFYWSKQHSDFIRSTRLTRLHNSSALQIVRKRKEKVNRLQQRLRSLALKDELTNVSNRHGLNQYVNEAFQMAKMEQFLFSAVLVDIDYFKEYNDTYGHLQGDQCIKSVARVLSQSIQKEGFISRYGGDEFMLIFVNKTLKEVEHLMQKIILAMKELHLVHNRSDYGMVTLTMGGVHQVPTVSSDMLDFIHAADNALYSIKRTTRNHYYISTEKL